MPGGGLEPSRLPGNLQITPTFLQAAFSPAVAFSRSELRQHPGMFLSQNRKWGFYGRVILKHQLFKLESNFSGMGDS